MDRESAKILGYRLKILRMQHDMKQRELAEKIGYAQSYVSDWECGRKIIPTEALMKIVRFFDVALDYFDPRNTNPDACSPPTVSEVPFSYSSRV